MNIKTQHNFPPTTRTKTFEHNNSINAQKNHQLTLNRAETQKKTHKHTRINVGAGYVYYSVLSGSGPKGGRDCRDTPSKGSEAQCLTFPRGGWMRGWAKNERH